MKRGLVTGTFDLLHAGHVHFLKIASENCDQLVIALQTGTADREWKNHPIQSVYERYVQLRGLYPKAEIIPYDNEYDLTNLIAMEDLYCRFLGSDYLYNNAVITGRELCIKRGIHIFYVPRIHTYSSTELRLRIQNEAVNEKSGTDRS